MLNKFGVSLSMLSLWQGSITLAEKKDLERVQKSACHIILGEQYHSYNKALLTLES